MTGNTIHRRHRVADPDRSGLEHPAVDPERQRLGAVEIESIVPSILSVGRSITPVSGSRLVIRQRPTWPPNSTFAAPDPHLAADPAVLGMSARRRRSRSASGTVAVDFDANRRPRSPSRARDAREISDTAPSEPRSTAVPSPASTSRRRPPDAVAERRRPWAVDELPLVAAREKNFVDDLFPEPTSSSTARPSGSSSRSRRAACE